MENEDHAADEIELNSLHQALASSSNKRRVNSLQVLQRQIQDSGLPEIYLTPVIDLLFGTYPYYHDRTSRRAVQACFLTLLDKKDCALATKLIVERYRKETLKDGLAPSNAFVLVELGSVFLPEAWEQQGLQLAISIARVLDQCIAAARASLKRSSIVAVRRAIRAIVRSDTIATLVSGLTAEGQPLGNRTATLLGIIAGVCARKDRLALEGVKNDFYTFYLREIVSSRQVLPDHISTALDDFFHNFSSPTEIYKEVVPTLEKALLRAPEVVLKLIPPLAYSLPCDTDQSGILAESLLKPLLSNVKSQNPLIRDGSVLAFAAMATRGKDDNYLAKISDEIAGSLSRSTTAEHRQACVQMLSYLPLISAKTGALCLTLAKAAVKEPNESALAAEVSALTSQLYRFCITSTPDSATVRGCTDAFLKGLSDKKPVTKKTWAAGFGEFLWQMRTKDRKVPSSLSRETNAQNNTKADHVLEFSEADGKPTKGIREHSDPVQQSLNLSTNSKAAVAGLVEALAQKMASAFDEVIQNPLAAGPLTSIAFIVTAIYSDMMNLISHEDVRSSFRKLKCPQRTLSSLLSSRVYSKISEDLKWVVRALVICSKYLNTSDCDAWAQAFIYVISATGVLPSLRQEAMAALTDVCTKEPVAITEAMTNALWKWYRHVECNDKDTAASAAKSGNTYLYLVVRSICEALKAAEKESQQTQLINMLVLCRPELLPRVSWIEACLTVGQDPGLIAKTKTDRCFEKMDACLESNGARFSSATIDIAVYNTAAELAFVAPMAVIPTLIEKIKINLPTARVMNLSLTDIAIARTPEGTAFIDVLSAKGQAYSVDKNSRDYDTLKWEEEIRKQIAQKKGQEKKLSSEEKAKVNAQLSKEAVIREEVHQLERTLRHGVGLIQALAVGPPTQAELWLGPSLKPLRDTIVAGAGRLLGRVADEAYLECAKFVSSRLGSARQFIGIATLRALGSSDLRGELIEEPLGDLVTRLLYRLRSASEQRPFDIVSLVYLLPLAFTVLSQGGISRSDPDEADEQITLALETLSYHTDMFSDDKLPREEVLVLLIESMQRYSQHYKLIKDCLSDICRSISDNSTLGEVAVLLKGVIVPQASVRTAVLQAIREYIDLTDADFCEEIWLACHDDLDENVELGQAIWQENALDVKPTHSLNMVPYLASSDRQLRRAASRSLADAVGQDTGEFSRVLDRLMDDYKRLAKPREPERDAFGVVKKTTLADPWENRSGIALSFREMAPFFDVTKLVTFVDFLIQDFALGDRNSTVRDEMIESATKIIASRGVAQLEELMQRFEAALDDADRKADTSDLVSEAVVVLYGALAGHLQAGDDKVPEVVYRLFATLQTPSETVQYAVGGCLPPLIQRSAQKTSEYVQTILDQLLHSKKYAARRGAAYGLAGLVKGKGIGSLREYRIMSTLRSGIESKKDQSQRQGALFAYEILALIMGRTFEPYIIQIVPQLLASFGDATADVREACLDASKTCFASLSSYGVKIILPTLLEGLEESQWRSKKGACDLLGSMAYLDPQQLALSLPDIIPPLTGVLNDSHKEVRASANRSLQRFGEVISNPEVKGLVNVLLKALSDPTKFTDEALDALIKVSFVHYLDSPSLALIVRILERALGERSASKRKSAQIIGSLAHLTERKDVTPHLPTLVTGLKFAVVDPVPATRATASKALGSLVEKLGEDALPDLIPSLMSTLKSDAGAGDRLGSAQALSEVLAGLGTGRLEETLPTILQNVASSKPTVREGFMSLFIYLPACFGNSFAAYLSKIIPPILAGLADDIESIRETSLRAGRLLVKNFATKAIDLLLPELDRGLADDNYRIRLSSVELVGDLLFNLTGISGKTEQDEEAEGATEAGQSLLEVLGEEKRNKILSSLYICRCDTYGLVRSAAINVWKALVATPRTLKELVPTLTQILIRRLANSNLELREIAGNALGELIRKAGEGVLATLLPTLEEGLQISNDTGSKQGICIALREIISSASPEILEDYEQTLISVVRIALVDPDDDVREAAAEAFDSLQNILGKRAVDQVLPHLLNLLRTENEADTALSALLTLLTDITRSNIILPNLVPTILVSPITPFNAKAIASLSEVAAPAMVRRLPAILNALMDNLVVCKEEDLRSDLEESFDAILRSVDEFDGLNTAMSIMLALVKNDDHRKRAVADVRLSNFFAQTDVDFSRYHQDLIRVLLISFDDADLDVVKAAWLALSELTKRLKKEEMEALVLSTRQILQQVGVPGANLPGFQLPKGINAILPIFLQGLMNGTADQRTQAALAISDIIDRTSPDSLKPFVTQITGPLIRVFSERSVDVRAAILLTLNNLLEKIPAFLKPFLPQLQRTFAKSLADTSSEILRNRAAKALGTLITLTPRIDPLIAELVTGSKTPDTGVQSAMLKALYEVVSKAGANMNETSRSSILGLIDGDTSSTNDAMVITNARLFGALVKNLPATFNASNLIKSRVLTSHLSNASVLNLNSVLLESPDTLCKSYAQETPAIICLGINSNNTFLSDNSVLAGGKYLLTVKDTSSSVQGKKVIEALAGAITPGRPVDTRRLALVVIRTLSRADSYLIASNIQSLASPIFASVRDPVIPVKLAAEAAFLAIFDVVEREGEVFEQYLTDAGESMNTTTKRSMQDYFKRVALRLGNQARERKEAEGDQGGLGLSNDEREDEREVWSVGKVDLGENTFRDD